MSSQNYIDDFALDFFGKHFGIFLHYATSYWKSRELLEALN